MTFSLVARCAKTGMLGMAIASSSPAVAARCAHTRAGVGAVASQNITDPSLGPKVLDLLGEGLSAADAMAKIVATTPYIQYRQLLVVDAGGCTAVHSGTEVLGIWGSAQADTVAAGGNLLANKTIPQVLVDTFLSAKGHLGDRLITAMQAALAAGGEAGPIHSAGMKIADRLSWPLVDLRCDWTEDCPIEAIEKAWKIYFPQIDAYVQRAENPSVAPSYGVPGDE
ncbi:MAG: DUF1028 domain-containing protein [Paracoccaceae bacterium]